MTLTSCHVAGAFMSLSAQGAAPIVMLDLEDKRCIPIYIGLWEALSITNAIHGHTLPRPITHDLFADAMERFDIIIRGLWIDELKEGVFYSRLLLQNEIRDEYIDCRPSDGIALVIRSEAPIYIEQDVIDEAAITRSEIGEIRDIADYIHAAL